MLQLSYIWSSHKEIQMKHKHAVLIKDWADEAKIPYYAVAFKQWLRIEDPAWSDHYEYRIKPKVKTNIIIKKHIFLINNLVCQELVTEKNVQYEFAGETGKLIKVELL